jgi:hypothetical protein
MNIERPTVSADTQPAGRKTSDDRDDLLPSLRISNHYVCLRHGWPERREHGLLRAFAAKPQDLQHNQ